MSTSLTNFTSETQLAVTATSLVSTSASEKKFIGSATVTNTSTSNVEVTLWLLATGTTGTAGSGGNWIWRETIPAGRTIKISSILGHVLGNSFKLDALADTANVVNIDISGTTEV